MSHRPITDHREVARHLPLRPVACAVLAALAHGPLPGIDVLEAVNATVPGRPILGPGTLYRLLRELRQDKLIARGTAGERTSADRDDRQVPHVLTPLGEAVLRAELARLRRTLTLADRTRPAAQR
jgi:DNA-binding PadR family transcriptional regulator